VLVPSLASVFSAAGLITTDVVYTFFRSANETVEAGKGLPAERLTELNKSFRELDVETQDALDVLNVPADRRELVHEVGLSYRRQILDFDVEVPAGVLTPSDVSTAVRAFDDRYAAIYGVGAAAPENGYDLKGFRVTGVGRLRRALPRVTGDVIASSPPPIGTRTALSAPDVDELDELDLYRGEQLPPGAELAGPAIVEYADTTLLVPRGWRARVDGYNNLVLVRS
jgi:N-methylhydantoinase A